MVMVKEDDMLLIVEDCEKDKGETGDDDGTKGCCCCC